MSLSSSPTSIAPGHGQLLDLMTDMITGHSLSSSPGTRAFWPLGSSPLSSSPGLGSSPTSRGSWTIHVIQSPIIPGYSESTDTESDDEDDQDDEYEPYDGELPGAPVRVSRDFSVTPTAYSGVILYPGAMSPICEPQTCIICTDDVIPGTLVIPLNCCHIFHVDCLSEWVCHQPTCPICRLPLPIKSV